MVEHVYRRIHSGLIILVAVAFFCGLVRGDFGDCDPVRLLAIDDGPFLA